MAAAAEPDEQVGTGPVVAAAAEVGTEPVVATAEVTPEHVGAEPVVAIAVAGPPEVTLPDPLDIDTSGGAVEVELPAGVAVEDDIAAMIDATMKEIDDLAATQMAEVAGGA